MMNGWYPCTLDLADCKASVQQQLSFEKYKAERPIFLPGAPEVSHMIPISFILGSVEGESEA